MRVFLEFRGTQERGDSRFVEDEQPSPVTLRLEKAPDACHPLPQAGEGKDQTQVISVTPPRSEPKKPSKLRLCDQVQHGLGYVIKGCKGFRVGLIGSLLLNQLRKL
jgi:hypothetical protein